jgi:hypothetical protein
MARAPGFRRVNQPRKAPAFTKEANENIRALGLDWQEDLKRLQVGEISPEYLLRDLLKRDVASGLRLNATGWIDYVHALTQVDK